MSEGRNTGTRAQSYQKTRDKYDPWWLRGKPAVSVIRGV